MAITDTIRADADAIDVAFADLTARLQAAEAQGVTDAGLITELRAGLAEALANARRPRGAAAGLTKYYGDVVLTDLKPDIRNSEVFGNIIAKTAYPVVDNVVARGRTAPATGETALVDMTSSVVKGATLNRLTIQPAAPTMWTSGIKGHHFRVVDSLFLNLCDGIQAFNTTTKGGDLSVFVEDCEMSDFQFKTGTPRADGITHNDGIMLQGGWGVTVLRTIFNLVYAKEISDPIPADLGSFSGLMFTTNANVGPLGPGLFEDNEFRGGSVPVNAGGAGAVDLGVFRRNLFDGKQTHSTPMILSALSKLYIAKGLADANRYANGDEMVPKVS